MNRVEVEEVGYADPVLQILNEARELLLDQNEDDANSLEEVEKAILWRIYYKQLNS